MTISPRTASTSLEASSTLLRSLAPRVAQGVGACRQMIDGGGMDDMLGTAFIGRERGTGRWLLFNHAWIHPIALERYGYAKARRIGMTAMVGGKDKTKIRNATPVEFRDVLLGIARTARQLEALEK